MAFHVLSSISVASNLVHVTFETEKMSSDFFNFYFKCLECHPAAKALGKQEWEVSPADDPKTHTIKIIVEPDQLEASLRKLFDRLNLLLRLNRLPNQRIEQFCRPI